MTTTVLGTDLARLSYLGRRAAAFAATGGVALLLACTIPHAFLAATDLAGAYPVTRTLTPTRHLDH